jgi:hypothetical protein
MYYSESYGTGERYLLFAVLTIRDLKNHEFQGKTAIFTYIGLFWVKNTSFGNDSF